MAAEAFQLASSHFIDEEYEEALEELNKAIGLDPKCAEYLDKRAAVFLVLKKYKNAKEDEVAAIALNPKKPQYSFRKGLACFNLDEFKEAKSAFAEAKRIHEESTVLPKKMSNQLSTWLRKCDAELEDEDEIIELETSGGGLEPAKPVETPAPVVPVPKVRYDYYQSPTHVTLSIMIKNCTEEEVSVQFQRKAVLVKISKVGSEFDKDFNLAYEINEEESKFKILTSKVEIKLQKQAAGIQWADLESVVVKPKVPSAYASKKNWEEIEQNLKKEEEEEKPEGDEALNKLFKQIYKDASDETRRAMIKSYQTSGGTVLSTNWDEVAKKDYEKERVAPNGMEWRNWEGDKIASDEGDEDEEDDYKNHKGRARVIT